MSQQGVLMGDGAGNPVGNDAMSTSGESVNQNIPPPPPGGEDVGGSLAPQENVLPGVSAYASGNVLSNDEASLNTSLVPYGGADPSGGVLSIGLSESLRAVGPPSRQMGDSFGTAASALAAAAASVLTQTAMSAAQQSAIAGQQAQQASQQSAAAGQQAQQAFNVGASALQQTHALRDETSQVLGQVKTGLETLHERQGAALSVAQNSDARSSEAVRMVEELQQARLADQQNFTDRMAQMERALKTQMEIAENSLKSINALRQELDTSRAESRTLRQRLTESNWKLASLSDQQTRNQQAQAQSAA